MPARQSACCEHGAKYNQPSTNAAKSISTSPLPPSPPPPTPLQPSLPLGPGPAALLPGRHIYLVSPSSSIQAANMLSIFSRTQQMFGPGRLSLSICSVFMKQACSRESQHHAKVVLQAQVPAGSAAASIVPVWPSGIAPPTAASPNLSTISPVQPAAPQPVQQEASPGQSYQVSLSPHSQPSLQLLFPGAHQLGQLHPLSSGG